MQALIDREGMFHDVRAMSQRMWRTLGSEDGQLAGNAARFLGECGEFVERLAFEMQCPDLMGMGLRGSIDTHTFRCGHCNQMQHGGTLGIWIPDSVMIGDPLWSIKEELADGGDTAWCVPCVRKLFKKAA